MIVFPREDVPRVTYSHFVYNSKSEWFPDVVDLANNDCLFRPVYFPPQTDLLRFVISPPQEKIVWLYKRWQPLYDIIKETVYPEVDFILGISLYLDQDSFTKYDSSSINTF